MSEMSGSEEFTVGRNGWAMSGHYGAVSFTRDGDTSGQLGGTSPEGILGRYLRAGSRIRVTVDVLTDAGRMDPAADGIGHHGKHPGEVSGCAECVGLNPTAYVTLECGHHQLARLWQAAGEPDAMPCKDAWATLHDGVPQRIVRRPEEAIVGG